MEVGREGPVKTMKPIARGVAPPLQKWIRQKICAFCGVVSATIVLIYITQDNNAIKIVPSPVVP